MTKFALHIKIVIAQLIFDNKISIYTQLILDTKSQCTTDCLYAIYLTRDSTAQRVCSPGVGLNPPEFLSPCGLPVSCCLTTSVVRSRARRGPRGLPSPRIFIFLRGMKAAFVPSYSSGPWRARRLNNADVDSRVWLASQPAQGWRNRTPDATNFSFAGLLVFLQY